MIDAAQRSPEIPFVRAELVTFDNEEDEPETSDLSRWMRKIQPVTAAPEIEVSM